MKLYLSLGCNCYVKQVIRDELGKLDKYKGELFHSLQSYPFDWITTDDMNSVLDLLETKFEDYLNTNYLIEKPREDNPKAHPHIYNTKYDITFVHDFDSTRGHRRNYKSDWSAVTIMYNRRISRLYDMINKASKIYFFRWIPNKDYDNSITYEETINRLKKIFPNKNIQYYFEYSMPEIRKKIIDSLEN